MKNNSATKICKITQLLKQEPVLYFYNKIESKKSNPKDLTYYDLRYSLISQIIKTTIFKNYSTFFKNTLLVIPPKKTKCKLIEKELKKSTNLGFIILNNKLYLNKKHIMYLSYKEKILRNLSLLKRVLSCVYTWNRNNVN
jgi:hypothetical protein